MIAAADIELRGARTLIGVHGSSGGRSVAVLARGRAGDLGLEPLGVSAARVQAE